jgi:hypothetical protein
MLKASTALIVRLVTMKLTVWSFLRSVMLLLALGGATYLSGSTALASILAGSVAGAIGVGVAFPLDTLKTKAQVIGGGSMLRTITTVYGQEGISGFFGGVKGTMGK